MKLGLIRIEEVDAPKISKVKKYMKANGWKVIELHNYYHDGKHSYLYLNPQLKISWENFFGDLSISIGKSEIELYNEIIKY